MTIKDNIDGRGVNKTSYGAGWTGRDRQVTLSDIRRNAQTLFEKNLTAFFDDADDALFDMAERAHLNSDQNMYFETMRELRLAQGAILVSYRINFDQLFEDMISGRNEVVNEAEKYNPSRLALVGDNELEEMVAVEAMVARALRSTEDEISLLSLRLDRVVHGHLIDNRNNALAPKFIAKAYIDASANVDMLIKSRLLLLKLFEQHVMTSLGQLYQTLNQQLAEAGVLPNVKLAELRKSSVPRRQRRQNEDLHRERSGTAEDKVFSQLQSLLQIRNSGPINDQGYSPGSEGSQESQGGYQSGGGIDHTEKVAENGNSGGQASPVASILDGGASSVRILRRNMLVDVLSSLQQPQAPSSTDASGYINELPRRDDILQLILQTAGGQQPEGESVELGRADSDAVNIIHLMFEYLVQEGEFALPMKALLGKLEIPMAKVAVMDKSLFGEDSHPARKLLDELANAGVGWVPQMNAARDFLYKKIREVVETLLEEFEEDVSVFQELLADFLQFREEDGRRCEANTRRTLDVECGKARSESATGAVTAEISLRINGLDVPEPIADLLQDQWHKVLFMIYLREGDSGDNWQVALQVIDELLWSIEPKRHEADRRRLMSLIPKLKRSLYNGLSRIGMNQFGINKLFDKLERYHADAAAGVSRQLRAEKSVAESMDRAYGSDADSAIVNAIEIGRWFEFTGVNGMVRCRLAAIVNPPGKYIFVDRFGHKQHELMRSDLARLIAGNTVKLLSDTQLFTQALATIQSGLSMQE
ncbi:MAG: DUF1631 domain-containing protein [Pseudomonadales bacterium]